MAQRSGEGEGRALQENGEGLHRGVDDREVQEPFPPPPTFEPMTSRSSYIDIYSSLGFLFYSVAAGDGAIRAAELDALKQLVREKWLPLEGSRDEFGTDSAHYIGISFDYASTNEMSAEEAYARFADAYQEKEKHYDPDMKQLVLRTATAIADAYKHRNKAEQSMLTRVRELLGK